MADFWEGVRRFFGVTNKRPDVPEYKGTKAFTSLKDIPETEEYLRNIKDRIAGRGVGYSPEVLSSATSPFAVSRRAALKEVTLPTISAQASARGVGRSTIPVGQAARESSSAERDIAERIAQLSLANEEQKRAEINKALSDLGIYTTQEVATRQAGSAQELGEFQTRRGLTTKYESEAQERERQQNSSLISFLSNVATAGMSGGASAAVNLISGQSTDMLRRLQSYLMQGGQPTQIGSYSGFRLT